MSAPKRRAVNGNPEATATKRRLRSTKNPNFCVVLHDCTASFVPLQHLTKAQYDMLCALHKKRMEDMVLLRTEAQHEVEVGEVVDYMFSGLEPRDAVSPAHACAFRSIGLLPLARCNKVGKPEDGHRVDIGNTFGRELMTFHNPQRASIVTLIDYELP